MSYDVGTYDTGTYDDPTPVPEPELPSDDVWGTLASDLLAAAVSSGVPVARSFVAPGPTFARDCRCIAVYASSFGVRPFVRGDFTGTCRVVPQVQFQVVFNADCVPTVDDSKRPPRIPTGAEISAWSTAFLEDADAVFTAVLGWAPYGDCSKITVADGVPFGPEGTMAELRWGVTISVTG